VPFGHLGFLDLDFDLEDDDDLEDDLEDDFDLEDDDNLEDDLEDDLDFIKGANDKCSGDIGLISSFFGDTGLLAFSFGIGLSKPFIISDISG
jgi:hypothetical protein